MSAYYYCIYPSPWGLPKLLLVAHQAKLVVADWQVDKASKPFDDSFATYQPILLTDEIVASACQDTKACHQLLQQTKTQLNQYFAKQRQVFDLPLALPWGTPFQHSVWHSLQTIGYGQTISYKQLAHQIGKPNAFRACANANGKNPISLIIPCHRVIASDGSLGGYTGGTAIKQLLLQHECG